MTTNQKPSGWAVPQPPPLLPAVAGLSYEDLQKCIHCGYCIQACPTYRQTGVELHSPRGRIALLRAVAEGKLPIDEGLAEPLDACLGCRACETACPSGVPYGHLLEEARALTASVSPAPWWVRLGLKHLMPYPARLRIVARLLRLAQRTGLLKLLPAAMRSLAEALPPVAVPRPYAAAQAGTVAFFHGCVQEAFLHGQNEAALQVIAAAGHAAAIPAGQTCCGALHAHTGDLEGARAMARRNIAAFEATGNGPIINHAGGCGAHLKEYGHLLKDDPAWAARAAAFTARVRDLSEWLAEVGLPDGALQPLDATVTYQDSCHLAHGQKVRQAPRAVLRSIPGIAYREMAAADQCCGSAGIYNIIRSDMADRVLAEKMGNVAKTGANLLVTANPGCYMQLCQGVRREGLQDQIEVLSLAELLARSLQQ